MQTVSGSAKGKSSNRAQVYAHGVYVQIYALRLLTRMYSMEELV